MVTIVCSPESVPDDFTLSSSTTSRTQSWILSETAPLVGGIAIAAAIVLGVFMWQRGSSDQQIAISVVPSPQSPDRTMAADYANVAAADCVNAAKEPGCTPIQMTISAHPAMARPAGISRPVCTASGLADGTMYTYTTTRR